jgi:hypothetical protein
MATLADIDDAHEAIRERWQADPALTGCLGYVFNLAYVNGSPTNAEGPIDAIIMGMNPGESPERPSGVSKKSEENWKRHCQDFADAVGGRWATSELFFWSSHDLGVLKGRVGEFGPYLEFCADLNRVMIDFHRPKVIFQPGLGWGRDAVEHYALRHVTTVKSPRRRGRLLEHYEMPDGTAWLNTAHWTASFGFSGQDKSDIKAYAARLFEAGGDSARDRGI